MRKRKNLRIIKVKKNQKLVIVQAKTEEALNCLMNQGDIIRDLAESVNKKIIFLSSDFDVIII